jgi:hypothetical protein
MGQLASGGNMSYFSAKYRAAIEGSLRAFVNDGDDVVCIGYFAYCYGNCKMCPKEGIKWHYVLENLRSQAVLIVGSECIENYQVILSEWGYKPEYIVFPDFLRAYARWILVTNPDAVVFDDGIVMRFQADCEVIIRGNSQPSGLQHFRCIERYGTDTGEQVRGVDEAGRIFAVGPTITHGSDAEYVEYEPTPEEAEWELYDDLGLDPDDPDFGELAAEGLDPDDYDWDSHDYEPD